LGYRHMNRKMYLPLACLLFCITYIVVADAPADNKMLLALAAGVFAIMLVRSLRSGK